MQLLMGFSFLTGGCSVKHGLSLRRIDNTIDDVFFVLVIVISKL